MQRRAPKGRYRVIGVGRIDTMATPSEAVFTEDCDTLAEAKALANRQGGLYLEMCVYDENGEVLHEAGSLKEETLRVADLENQRKNDSELN